MPEHLTARCQQPFRAHEAPLARQQERDRDGAYGRDAREHCKSGAPADQVGDHSGDQPAAESSETRSRRIDARGGRCFFGRPFVADIGNGHGKDRRQNESLHRAPEDDRRQAGRQPDHQSRNDQDEHRRDDHALAAEHVGYRAGERRSEGDRQSADGDDGRDFRRAGVKFLGEQRKNRLWRIEIDEGAIPGKADREMTRGMRSAFGSGAHKGGPGGRVCVNARSYALVRYPSPREKMAGLRLAQCIALSFQVERHLRANEGFFRGSGRIDSRPVDAAQLEFFLILHDGCVRVGRVARPRADALKP